MWGGGQHVRGGHPAPTRARPAPTKGPSQQYLLRDHRYLERAHSVSVRLSKPSLAPPTRLRASRARSAEQGPRSDAPPAMGAGLVFTDCRSMHPISAAVRGIKPRLRLLEDATRGAIIIIASGWSRHGSPSTRRAVEWPSCSLWVHRNWSIESKRNGPAARSPCTKRS